MEFYNVMNFKFLIFAVVSLTIFSVGTIFAETGTDIKSSWST